MKPSQSLREVIEKQYGRALTEAEYQESISNLVGFVELLIEIDQQNQKGGDQ